MVSDPSRIRIGTRLIFLAQRPFIRSVAAMAGGAAAAQAITVAFSPIITRLYGPEAFGVQGAFLALISIVAPLSALTYPIAIVLPKCDAEARSIMRLAMFVACSMAVFAVFGLLVFNNWIEGAFGNQRIAPYLPLLPLMIVLSAGLQVTRQWLIRKKQFPAIARIMVIQTLLTNSAKASFGFISATAATLVAITTAAMGGLILMQAAKGRALEDKSTKHARVPIRHMACQYSDFPLFRAPEMALGAISQGLPILILATAFGPEKAGFYALARSVINLPVDLIGRSVSEVFYPRFNNQSLKGLPLLPLLLRAIGTLAIIGLPIFITISLLSPLIFRFAFGLEWELAGHYSRWLSLWLFFTFINYPCLGVTSVLNMQKLFLMQGIGSLVIRLGALWIGWRWFDDDLLAVQLFSLASAFSVIVLIIIVVFWVARDGKQPNVYIRQR